MQTIKIELTREEAQVLTNLMNIAVKAVGLEGAESALHFVKKINEASQAAQRAAQAQAAIKPAPDKAGETTEKTPAVKEEVPATTTEKKPAGKTPKKK